jgi:hypothetical protein
MEKKVGRNSQSGKGNVKNGESEIELHRSRNGMGKGVEFHMTRDSAGYYTHGNYTVWRQDNRYMRNTMDNWNVNFRGKFIKAFDSYRSAKAWVMKQVGE